MNREQVNHISNRHYKKLQEQYKKVTKHFDMEDIHQWRVEYKKLRSFLRMISLCSRTGEEIKISKKLKTAYHIFGCIRDLQLQRQRILKAVKGQPEKPQAYLSQLQKEINKLKPELSIIFSKKTINNAKKKTAFFFPEKFQLTGFKLFAKRKWAAVHSIIAAGNFSDDNMHSIRKNLKDIFYNLRLYKTAEQEKIFKTAGKGKDWPYFHQLVDELGNFQNSCMALGLLKSYPPNTITKYNQQIFEKIKKEWGKEKINLKRLLVNKLKLV